MTLPGSNAGGNDPDVPSGLPRILIADPRKFSEYVLVLERERSKGKHHFFLDLLGYRPRNVEDAQVLSATYVMQAQAKFAVGQFEIGKRDHHGQRYTIEIELKDVVVRSGWLWRADGVFWLTTPSAGFARRDR